MKHLAWLIIATWLLAPLPGAAEWYKYRDKNGVWHYSDTLTTEVPFEKRKKAQKFHEADDYLNAEQKARKRQQEAKVKAQADEASTVESKQKAVKDQYRNLEDYKALEQKRVELDGIYKRMQEQKRKMDIQKDKVDSPAAYRQYRSTVSKYNERAKEYQLRREAYEQALKQYEQNNKALAKKKEK